MIFTSSVVIFTASLNLVSKYASTYELLMVGRFLSGIYCGLYSGVQSTYLSELSPVNKRALIGGLYQLFVIFGLLSTNIYGLRQVFGTENSWQFIVGACLYVPSTIHIIGLSVLAPESPKFLYMNLNNKEAARKVLLKLRGAGSETLVDKELELLERERLAKMNQRNVTWSELLKDSSMRHRLLVAILLLLSSQFSGYNAITFYSTDILRSIGLSGDWPLYTAILLSCVSLVMNFVCIMVIDRVGTRTLMVVGMAGMCLSAFLIGIFRIYGVCFIFY